MSPILSLANPTGGTWWMLPLERIRSCPMVWTYNHALYVWSAVRHSRSVRGEVVHVCVFCQDAYPKQLLRQQPPATYSFL
eukprot:3339303-Amphidinium_carterae.1